MRRAVLLAVVGVVVVLYSSPAPAQSTTSSSLGTAAVAGTTIKVNTNADESNTDGDCSLREAIEAANTNKAVDGCAAGSSTKQDAIHFALGTQARITLGSTLPTITDPSALSIYGQKAKITVSGDDKVGVFEVGEGAKLALLQLTVANGHSFGDLGYGGGILNDGGTLTVANSTFSGNSDNNGGGGIANLRDGTLTVSNSTFSGNRAGNSTRGPGGGIANFGTATVSNSTFSGNSANEGGGGIRNDRGKVTLKNTIVANNPNGKNCLGQITDGGYNLEGGTACGFSAANNSLPSTNPKLANSLADNGGPTLTIKLLDGSPAINAIPQATNGCGIKIRTDQRGVKRPQGNRCEIGAFEKRQ